MLLSILLCNYNCIKLFQVKSVIVVGTISVCPSDSEWYYNSCKECTKKIEIIEVSSDEVDGSGSCVIKQVVKCALEKCNEKGVTVVPRYVLKFFILFIHMLNLFIFL